MSGHKLPPITIAEARAGIGVELVSPWRQVTQQIIDQFADATDDHQYIHTDPVRAAETPYGGTIAHGFLLLSLLSAMTFEAVPPLAGATMGVNQGFDDMRFIAPVKAGARIRTKFTLEKLKARPSGWIEIVHAITMQIEGEPRPALTARWLTLAFVPPEEQDQEETAT